MKSLAFVAIVAGVGLLWYVLSKPTEGFQSEFLDRSGEKRTDEMRASSYLQETNHFKMTTPLEQMVPGISTPYRVNMYNSYIPA
jgi:hypothetical protein